MSSLIIALLLNSKISNYNYQLLPLLPLTFGFCSCLFFNVIELLFKRWSITLVIGMFYFRVVLIPLFMFLGNFQSLILNSVIYDNMNTAILLLVYETIVIFITLSIKTKELNVLPKKLISVEYNIFNSKSFLLKLIISAMIIFIVLCLFFYPQLTAYTNFFISSSIEKTIKQNQDFLYMTKVTPRIVYRFYEFIFNILQIIVPVLFIQYFYKKFGHTKPKKAVIYSFFIASIFILIMTPEKANSILIGINLFILIYYMYPQIIKKIFPLMMLLGITIVFSGLLMKSNIDHSDNIFESLSSVLTAYFGGPDNISVAVSMNRFKSKTSIFSDIVTSIPFLSYFFTKLVTSPKIFNLTIYGNSTRGDQIIPMIGQGFYYFGFILAPIFSSVCVSLSVKFEKKGNKSSDLFLKYIYLYSSLILAIMPVIYNFNIIITISFNVWVVFFIAKMTKKPLKILERSHKIYN